MAQSQIDQRHLCSSGYSAHWLHDERRVLVTLSNEVMVKEDQKVSGEFYEKNRGHYTAIQIG